MYARYNAVLRGLARPAAAGDAGTLRGLNGRPELHGTACTVLTAEHNWRVAVDVKGEHMLVRPAELIVRRAMGKGAAGSATSPRSTLSPARSSSSAARCRCPRGGR